MNRKQTMVNFLQRKGISVLGIEEHTSFNLKAEGYMDLHVEAWKEGEFVKVSVSHTYEQNGDLMRDPEIVYRVFEGLNGPEELPESFQNDGIGIFQQVYYEKEGVKMVRPRLQNDLIIFTRTWVRNLQAQGHELKTIEARTELEAVE